MYSNKHTSRHVSRNLIWTRQILDPTVQFPICRSRQSYWSELQPSSCWIILTRHSCYHGFSLPIVLNTRWRRPLWKFCQTSCLRSTPVTWLHWSFWTCLQPSTCWPRKSAPTTWNTWARRNRSTLVRVVPGRPTDNSMFVLHAATSSSPTVIECGVPQGSVLDPILFLLYVADS